MVGLEHVVEKCSLWVAFSCFKSDANILETSQELRMLSSVTLNCHTTKIVMNSGSQLSEL